MGNSLKYYTCILLEAFSVMWFSSLLVWLKLTTTCFLHGRREGDKMCTDYWVVVSLRELRSEFHANAVAIQA